MSNRKWLLYAIGNGWGHLNRGLAFARLAARTRSIDIICNSSYAKKLDELPAWQKERVGQAIRILSWSGQSKEDVHEHVREIVSWDDYECVLIDTFPRGITGELVDVLPKLQSIRRILVARQLNKRYVEQFNLPEFVRDNFDEVINPGEFLSVEQQLDVSFETAHWLIRNQNELPSSGEMRELLNVPPRSPFVLVISSGSKIETEFYGQLTNHIAEFLPHSTVRCLSFEQPECLSPELWINHWPGIECISACDIAIGGAGYNTIAEARALKKPLIAIPQRRTYDTQSSRAKQCEYVAYDFETVMEILHSIDLKISVSEKTMKMDNHPFENGAEAALKFVEGIL